MGEGERERIQEAEKNTSENTFQPKQYWNYALPLFIAPFKNKWNVTHY